MLKSHRRLVMVECLSCITGGYLNAYTYGSRGHVFATAETGNVVLFGLDVATHHWPAAILKLYLIAAFIGGILFAKRFAGTTDSHDFRAVLVSQSVELVALSILSAFAETLPDEVVVVTISFLSAVQITSFNRLGKWSFNSTMTTGNLRRSVSGLLLWLQGTDAVDGRGQFLVAALASSSFCVGAVVGGICSGVSSRFQLLPCICILCAAIGLTKLEQMKRGTLVRSDTLK